LFIGLTSGAYSSIFIASPLLAILKEREPRYKSIRRRLESRGGAHQLLSPAEVARSARNAAATSAARRGAVAAKSAAPKRSAGSQRAVIVPGSGSSSGSAIASSAKRDNRASESEIDEDDSDFEDLDPDFTGVLGKSGSSDQEVADGKAESGGSDDTELDDSHVSDQPGGDQGEDSGTDQGEDSGGSSGRVGSGATDPAASGSKTGSSGTPARVPVRPRKKRKR
ncbi:MAG TPA: hypothetical protein VMU77_05235, partial [Acidimicrobiales bacterium]|nr:hypothetical protein [Acidimicrobiales bacterium]